MTMRAIGWPLATMLERADAAEAIGLNRRASALLDASESDHSNGGAPGDRSGPVAVVHVGEKVVAPLDLLEPFGLRLLADKLLVNPGEAQEVFFHSLAGVARARLGPKNEGPIAGLRQEQLARGLLEQTLLQRVRLRQALRSAALRAISAL